MRGVLPFLATGALHEQGSADPVIGCEAIPVSPVWPAGGSNSAVGRSYDHTAEAHHDFAADLQATNRRLVIDGRSYAIIGAVVEPMGLAHVALRLRETRAGGGG